MMFRKHDIVDYFDSRTISSGLILEIDERRLRILNDHGKETKISSSRVLIAGKDPDFPLSGTREAQINRLKAISQLREEIKSRIDLRELWEIVSLETDEIGLDDLSELFFGRNDSDDTASLLRAIFEDRLYFRIKPDKIEVPSPERVQQALIQREKERERTSFAANAAEFLSKMKGPQPITADAAPEGLIPMLEEAAQYGRDWVTFKQIKEILSQAGLPQQVDPFRILVMLGVWSEDENITLRAENIATAFSREMEAEAALAAGKPLMTDVEDLTREEVITIDSPSTRDVDDALSLSRKGEDWILGVHITDVAHFVEHDSFLDTEVRQRATSIYLPDTIIPMIPAVLSEHAASLIAGEIRPAISLMAEIGPDYQLKSYRIVESVVRVSERLSYDEADERISRAGSKEHTLFVIASALRKARLAAGAIIFKDPELGVHVNEDGSIEVNLRDRETPSQILVSEIMIFANNFFARFLKENAIPGIYRSQAPPLEKIELGDEYDPVVSYRSKKALSRGDLSTVAGPHSTLGLALYTTATSPLRRYPDLLVQRQLKSVLRTNQPAIHENELEQYLSEICYRLERAVLLERERQRYFLLKYLEQRKNEEFEALVLHRFPKFYLVHITGLCFNAALNASAGLSLSPRDRVLAKVDRVNPRDDKLVLSLVKVL
ncbi:MAG TPA: RNB domain-containing ribonuclease [Desulfomonilaceae bacterium]|nr:RNB domain-containing ribonuclease [Desulfomonilaceae bacterium]